MHVTKEDVKQMLGIDYDLEAFAELDKLGLSYRKMGEGERDTAILECIKRIKDDKQIVGTPERTMVWERGWSENLEEFKKSGDVNVLYPKYFHSGMPIRYLGDLIISDLTSFQVQLDLFVKRCLFEIYASSKGHIYEFGCGTGYNLVMLADMFPDKTLYGMDLTESAVEILNILQTEYGYKINGKQFDFVQPDYNLAIKDDSAVFTFAALEQIGDRFKWFRLPYCQ